MSLIDDQIKQFEALDVPQTKQPDFDAFWADTLAAVNGKPLDVQGGRIDYPISRLDVRDITYSGLDGTRVKAWLILPPEAKTRNVPCIAAYHGASGSRGTPAWFTQYTSMGCAVVTMDFRMQGGLTGSDTGFLGSSKLGWTALGVTDKRTSYYYHVLTDGLRLLRVAKETQGIDPKRIAVEGGSQGGGTALTMAALDTDVALCLADVPSSCWFEKRLLDRTGGAADIANFIRIHPELVDDVMKTLSYFDNINLAPRITCPVFVSCGMKDNVCPPECVYAAYNKITSEKRIVPYPYAEHSGGEWRQQDKKLAYLRDKFAL
ncbi:acetylxylan esterase [bacterium]|nr:acetylxylan esterase [bacterium]